MKRLSLASTALLAALAFVPTGADARGLSITQGGRLLLQYSHAVAESLCHDAMEKAGG